MAETMGISGTLRDLVSQSRRATAPLPRNRPLESGQQQKDQQQQRRRRSRERAGVAPAHGDSEDSGTGSSLPGSRLLAGVTGKGGRSLTEEQRNYAVFCEEARFAYYSQCENLRLRSVGTMQASPMHAHDLTHIPVARLEASFDEESYAYNRQCAEEALVGRTGAGRNASGARPAGAGAMSHAGPVKHLFAFYARLQSPGHQLATKALTYDEIQHANETMSFLELLHLLRDFNVVPKLMSRTELRILWEHIQIGTLRDLSGQVHTRKALTYEYFADMLAMIAVFVYSKPGLRSSVAPDMRVAPGTATAHGLSAQRSEIMKVHALCQYMHLHEPQRVKHIIRTVGRETAGRLNYRAKGETSTHVTEQLKRERELTRAALKLAEDRNQGSGPEHSSHRHNSEGDGGKSGSDGSDALYELPRPPGHFTSPMQSLQGTGATTSPAGAATEHAHGNALEDATLLAEPTTQSSATTIGAAYRVPISMEQQVAVSNFRGSKAMLSAQVMRYDSPQRCTQWVRTGEPYVDLGAVISGCTYLFRIDVFNEDSWELRLAASSVDMGEDVSIKYLPGAFPPGLSRTVEVHFTPTAAPGDDVRGYIDVTVLSCTSPYTKPNAAPRFSTRTRSARSQPTALGETAAEGRKAAGRPPRPPGTAPGHVRPRSSPAAKRGQQMGAPGAATARCATAEDVEMPAMHTQGLNAEDAADNKHEEEDEAEDDDRARTDGENADRAASRQRDRAVPAASRRARSAPHTRGGNGSSIRRPFSASRTYSRSGAGGRGSNGTGRRAARDMEGTERTNTTTGATVLENGTVLSRGVFRVPVFFRVLPVTAYTRSVPGKFHSDFVTQRRIHSRTQQIQEYERSLACNTASRANLQPASDEMMMGPVAVGNPSPSVLMETQRRQQREMQPQMYRNDGLFLSGSHIQCSSGWRVFSEGLEEHQDDLRIADAIEGGDEDVEHLDVDFDGEELLVDDGDEDRAPSGSNPMLLQQRQPWGPFADTNPVPATDESYADMVWARDTIVDTAKVEVATAVQRGSRKARVSNLMQTATWMVREPAHSISPMDDRTPRGRQAAVERRRQAAADDSSSDEEDFVQASVQRQRSSREQLLELADGEEESKHVTDENRVPVSADEEYRKQRPGKRPDGIATHHHRSHAGAGAGTRARPRGGHRRTQTAHGHRRDSHFRGEKSHHRGDRKLESSSAGRRSRDHGRRPPRASSAPHDDRR